MHRCRYFLIKIIWTHKFLRSNLKLLICVLRSPIKLSWLEFSKSSNFKNSFSLRYTRYFSHLNDCQDTQRGEKSVLLRPGEWKERRNETPLNITCKCVFYPFFISTLKSPVPKKQVRWEKMHLNVSGTNIWIIQLWNFMSSYWEHHMLLIALEAPRVWYKEHCGQPGFCSF